MLGFAEHIDNLRHELQMWHMPNLIKYSLPDGLYCASYVLITDAIWHNNTSVFKHFIVVFIPIAAISNETLQLFHIAEGTFDFYDLICYSIPFVAYIVIIKTNNKF